MLRETLADFKHFVFKGLSVFEHQDEDSVTRCGLIAAAEVSLAWANGLEEGCDFASRNAVEEAQHALGLVITHQTRYDIHLSLKLFATLNVYVAKMLFFTWPLWARGSI